MSISKEVEKAALQWFESLPEEQQEAVNSVVDVMSHYGVSIFEAPELLRGFCTILDLRNAENLSERVNKATRH